MMRYLILFILLYRNIAISQDSDFPRSWEGDWSGNISIYTGSNPGTNPAQVLPVSLIITPISEERWSWVLSYEAPGQVPRNYELIKDSEGNWKIDEKNGIILPQTIIGGRMASSFSVMGNLLICYYWIENDALNMEIHMVKQEGISKTGLDTEESPEVSSHLIGVFQKAVLYRK